MQVDFWLMLTHSVAWFCISSVIVEIKSCKQNIEDKCKESITLRKTSNVAIPPMPIRSAKNNV